MDNQANQCNVKAIMETKKSKSFKSGNKVIIWFLALLMIALMVGCSGGVFSNVEDAFSSSNNAVETGVDDGVDAINDGVNDGTDAISDTTDDIEDEFQTEANLVSIEVTPSNSLILEGGTKSFKAKAKYINNSTRNVTNSSYWTSGSTNVATINSNTGIATGVTSGTSTIRANYLGKSDSATITIK